MKGRLERGGGGGGLRYRGWGEEQRKKEVGSLVLVNKSIGRLVKVEFQINNSFLE